MKSCIIVWSLPLMLLMPPMARAAWAQHPTEPKTVPAAVSTHPEAGKPAAKPEAAHADAAKGETKAKPEAKPEHAAKPQARSEASPKGDAHAVGTASAEKPATPPRPVSNLSAAERILERLNKEFPYKKPTTSPTPASTSRRSGTPTAPHASNRVTLSWRLSLRWPDEIAPKATPAPLGPVKLVWR